MDNLFKFTLYKTTESGDIEKSGTSFFDFSRVENIKTRPTFVLVNFFNGGSERLFGEDARRIINLKASFYVLGGMTD